LGERGSCWRSILFNLAFYLNLVIWLINRRCPTFFMPYYAIVNVAKAVGPLQSYFCCAVICGLKAEFRGVEKIPRGGALIAAKHQSTWETFSLLWMFEDPTSSSSASCNGFRCSGGSPSRGRMIPVDRGAGSAGLTAMTALAAKECSTGRQIVIFPEGTRRPAGAEPAYKYGISSECMKLAVWRAFRSRSILACSGMRRSIIRLPGTVGVEVLDPIGRASTATFFMERLQNDIEAASARLIEEGEREIARLTGQA
jgi:1-acyl-sn-glycerol-3-phosphate acyltransferase